MLRRGLSAAVARAAAFLALTGLDHPPAVSAAGASAAPVLVLVARRGGSLYLTLQKQG